MQRRFALTEQSFTAATPDNTIFVRVALGGHTLGVQIEPAAMKRPATEIAQQIMACNDVAYLKGQLVIRTELEGRSIPVDDMPTEQDLADAERKLGCPADTVSLGKHKARASEKHKQDEQSRKRTDSFH